jgi:hypothetical protein
MREPSATNVDDIVRWIFNLQIIVGTDCAELQYLVKRRICARSFGIVEDKRDGSFPVEWNEIS